MGGTRAVEQVLGRPVARLGLLVGLAVACAWVCIGIPAAASAGCVVTFRHGEAVKAERCEDAGAGVAYVRFGGWVVVLKSALVSVEDERGLTRFNPPWTPVEARGQLQGLPTEGGVPVAPVPEPAPAPSPPPQTVVYYPVPVPVPTQDVYEAADSPAYYPAGVVFCRHCLRPPKRSAAPPPPSMRTFPFQTIGPQAIQRSFPSISPLR
jgi:hypothetical protein